MRATILWSVGLLLQVGCGDDSGPTDAGRPADAGAADSGPDRDSAAADAGPELDAGTPTRVGEPCASDTACAPGLFCLDEDEDEFLPADGYCTAPCVSDADCGPGAVCTPAIDDEGVRLCVATCDDDRGCGRPNHICHDRLIGLVEPSRPFCFPGDAAAVDGDPCDTISDCNASSLCFQNPFDFPEGYCVTLGCTEGDDTTCAPGGDGICVTFGGDLGVCLDGCDPAVGSCRETEGYVCLDVLADGSLNVCAYPAEDTGNPCERDDDCGPPPWECVTGVFFPGGYCGARACDPDDEATCPQDSICHDPDPEAVGDEVCIRECEATDECRVGEGYECVPTGDRTGCRVPAV